MMSGETPWGVVQHRAGGRLPSQLFEQGLRVLEIGGFVARVVFQMYTLALPPFMTWSA